MKYLRYILYRLVFVALTKIGRDASSAQVKSKNKLVWLLNFKRISVLTHALTAISFPKCKIGRLVLNLFQTRDSIIVLCQFVTLTQFLFIIHEYFLISENSKYLIWKL